MYINAKINSCIHSTNAKAYFVTSCIACAKYATFLDVTPAIDMRPSFVK